MKKLILILFTIALGIFFFLAKTKNSSLNLPPQKSFHRLSTAGSVGLKNIEQSITSFKQNAQKLDYLSLYWYEVDEEGRISRRDEVKEANENDLLRLAKEKNVKILVGIESGEGNEKLEDILEDAAERSRHISDVVGLAEEKGYDGIIIDYEYLQQDQAEKFTAYIQELSEALKEVNKILGVSVNVETKGRIFHGIDIIAVSKIVDRMHLSVYEQYGEETGPGPIASIDWVNTIIKNVIDQGVSPDKIILGTAHSGHDWIVSPEEEFFDDMNTKETLVLLSKTNATVIWDGGKQANYFEYRDDEGKKHVVWLEDAKSFKAKIDLAKSYELKGMFIWYLGGEDPNIWEVLF